MEKKILFIDDDADDPDMFCEALKAAAPKFICYTAPNGQRALMALDNQESRYQASFFRCKHAYHEWLTMLVGFEKATSTNTFLLSCIRPRRMKKK